LKRAVTIVDYGVGNLLSVSRALEHCGADVRLSDSPEDVTAADRLVLPGVGAFRDGMNELAKRGLDDALKRYAETNRPFLGICLGMQMMLDESEEFGVHAGLGMIRGSVRAIPEAPKRKIPHVGWSPITRPEGRTWNGTVLEGLEPGQHSAYFVHSYSASTADGSNVLATCEYDGCTLTAAVQSGPRYGCQFHPEKSGPVGLSILRRFLELA